MRLSACIIGKQRKDVDLWVLWDVQQHIQQQLQPYSPQKSQQMSEFLCKFYSSLVEHSAYKTFRSHAGSLSMLTVYCLKQECAAELALSASVVFLSIL